MWSELLDFAMQDTTIELAAAFVLGTASWAIVSTTIRTAYKLRSRRKRTPPPEAEAATPSHEAPAGGVEEAPAHPAPFDPEVPAEDEVLESDLSAPVQDEAFEPQSTARDMAPAEPVVPNRSWWARLRDGLSRSSGSIGAGLAAIFTKRKLDAEMLDDLEAVLIRADLGVATAAKITKAIGKERYD